MHIDHNAYGSRIVNKIHLTNMLGVCALQLNSFKELPDLKQVISDFFNDWEAQYGVDNYNVTYANPAHFRETIRDWLVKHPVVRSWPICVYELTYLLVAKVWSQSVKPKSKSKLTFDINLLELILLSWGILYLIWHFVV